LGECAYTGLHGANRLASNSLLEAMVLSKNCSSFIGDMKKIDGGSIRISEVTPRNLSYEQEKYVIGLKKRLQTNMELYVGLIRTRAGLESGLIKLKEIQNEVEGLIRLNYWSKDLFELRNMLITSERIIAFSLKRKESIGAFYLQEN
jgi:L-aspartate oxidase